jgi:hypothetical protein
VDKEVDEELTGVNETDTTGVDVNPTLEAYVNKLEAHDAIREQTSANNDINRDDTSDDDDSDYEDSDEQDSKDDDKGDDTPLPRLRRNKPRATATSRVAMVMDLSQPLRDLRNSKADDISHTSFYRISL